MNNHKRFRWYWNRVIRDENYMTRYGLRTPWFCIFVHVYTGADDADYHNHPWDKTWSIVLKGMLIEHELIKLHNLANSHYQCVRTPFYKQDFYPKLRTMTSDTFHKITRVEPGTVTLFIASKRIQQWRFLDNKTRN